MTEQYDITIKKPVAVWNRDLSISPREFFGALSKAVISGAVLDGKGVAENLLDAAKDIVPQDLPAYAAWWLIYRALQQSLSELVNEYQEFFTNQPDDQAQQELASELETALNAIEVGFDARFFDDPAQLPLLDAMRDPLLRWLTGLGMTEAQANALHLRLKQRFVLALHQQWLDNPSEYVGLEEALHSPFIEATKVERGWMQYRAWLQEQPNQRMFAEAFSLTQVFVPLRAYYEEKAKQSRRDGDDGDSTNAKAKHEEKAKQSGRDGDDLDGTDAKVKHEEKAKQSGRAGDDLDGTDAKVKRIVVDLHTEVEAWVRHFDPDHAVRIISGGPGSGKSSFAKMFAAFVAREMEELPVIFVPLHHFDPSDNLVAAMEEFVKQERFLSGSPLDASEGKQRLLIIFDGLDELSMQGKVAAEAAQLFVDEVVSTIDKFSGQGFERQVLITGRDLAVQSASGRLRGERQVLHVLPYFVSDQEQKDYSDDGRLLAEDQRDRWYYSDDEELLAEDQRDRWWKNYGAAKGASTQGLPAELAIERLTPITREPLLNYLVALSYERKTIEFSEQTTLNTIYQDLLYAVHERQWDHGPHQGAGHLDINQFTRVLEEIALAVWHGDGRTATVAQIFKHCESSNLTRYLAEFQEGAKKGVSRLLTAFYFRQSEQIHAGDKTFEFTHKSFGEYLTARRIVRLVRQIQGELTRHDEDPDTGFDEREALKRWAELCGPTTMDPYVFRFLCDEVAGDRDGLKGWQPTFARLIGFAVRKGVPMELTDVRPFKEMMRQSRNAEEALMVVHYACTSVTRKLSIVDRGINSMAFGEWINRLLGQRTGAENRLILDCLAFLDLQGCILDMGNFYEANLVGSNFQNTSLRMANFGKAIMTGVNLRRADLSEANLCDANLDLANLEGADLRGVDLARTSLKNVDLRGTGRRVFQR